MSSQKRKYELKERARAQEQTRRRIVEATAGLHEEVGPARTTISEIARRAGVRRPTVYRHFPEEAQLFEACAGHFMAAHPLPDLGDALVLKNPKERVRVVLCRLYSWYRETEAMSANTQRDRLFLPAVDELAVRTMDAPMAEVASALAAGFGARGRRAGRMQALVAVALDFWTWRRLKGQGIEDAAAAALMADAIASL